MNAAFATLQCFAGDQWVRTARGRVRMDALRVGDLALTLDEAVVRNDCSEVCIRTF